MPLSISTYLRTPRGQAALLMATATVVLGAGLGLRDPWPADEPRFALVASQMVDSGNWLFPRRGGELYADKPPLFMWIQAALLQLTGNLRIAFLLPSVLSGIACVWMTYDLGRRLWSKQAGIYAGWALLLAVQFTLQMKRAQIDPLLLAWVTLAHYGLIRHIVRGPDWRMWTVAWFAAGLGVITKGVGVIALFMLVPALALTFSRKMSASWIGDRRAWLGPLALLVAIGIWLIPMLIAVWIHPTQENLEYARNILFRQTIQRYGNSWHHFQAPWYFLVVIATSWLPTIALLPWAGPSLYKGLCRFDERLWLPVGSLALIVLFFSVPAGKRDMYILPGLPMLCLAFAASLPDIVGRVGVRRLATAFVSLLGTATATLGIWMLASNPRFEVKLLTERGSSEDSHSIAILVLLASLPLLVGAALSLSGSAWKGLLTGMSGFWVVYGFAGPSVLNEASSSRGLMEQVSTRIGPSAQLGLVGWREQQLLMSQSATAEFGFNRPARQQLATALSWQQERQDVRWLLIEGSVLENCGDRRPDPSLQFGVANRRTWWLIPAGALSTCETSIR